MTDIDEEKEQGEQGDEIPSDSTSSAESINGEVNEGEIPEPAEASLAASWWKTKIGVSLLLGLCLAAIFLPFTRAHLFDNPLFLAADEKAVVTIEESITRATIAFAVARAINATVSVLQDSEIEVSVFGNGATLALFEVLDPINDLVESFSWIMLMSLTSLGVQRFLVEISSWLSIDVLVVLGLLSWLAGIWMHDVVRINFVAIGKRLVFFALVIRFAMPCMAYVNDYVYQRFLADQHNQAVSLVQAETETLQGIDPLKELVPGGADAQTQLNAEEEEGQRTLTQRFSEGWESTKASFSPVKMAAKVKGFVSKVGDVVERLIDNLVSLIIIFVINTVLLPIGFLWGLVSLFRFFTGSVFGLSVEQSLKRRIIK